MLNLAKAVRVGVAQTEYSHGEFALVAGVAEPSMSIIRKGKIIPTIPTLLKISKGCGLKLSELIALGES